FQPAATATVCYDLAVRRPLSYLEENAATSVWERSRRGYRQRIPEADHAVSGLGEEHRCRRGLADAHHHAHRGGDREIVRWRIFGSRHGWEGRLRFSHRVRDPS